MNTLLHCGWGIVEELQDRVELLEAELKRRLADSELLDFLIAEMLSGDGRRFVEIGLIEVTPTYAGAKKRFAFEGSKIVTFGDTPREAIRAAMLEREA